jgi:hypothetical protein
MRTYRRGSSHVPNAKDSIATDSKHPLVIAVDVTGSMDEWPGIIFEKLPLLYGEVKRYLPDVEISFAAIGDAFSDSHPLQVCPFGAGKALDDRINALYPEGGGGGTAQESYELAGHYYLTRCDMPKATKPILIFTGDEGFYDLEAKTVSDVLGTPGVSRPGIEVMKELAKKFDTYILRKRYQNGASDEDARIQKQWKEALGDDRVIQIQDPRRIVDCIIGIVSAAAGRFDDYTTRLSQRQTVAQVDTVMKSLKKLGCVPTGDKALSLRKLPAPGATSKKLTEE